MLVVYASLAVVLVLLLLYVRRFSTAPNAPPYKPGLIPFVGNGIQFAKDPIGFTTNLHKELGPIYTLNILGQRLTFIASTEGHKPFFTGSDEEMDQNEPYKFAVPLFGEGVVYGTDLATRSQQIKFIRGGLRTDKMKTYVPIIVKETEDFFARWGDEGIVDISNELSELIILTASACLMGPEIRENLSGEVARLFKLIDQGLTPISVFFPYLPIPQHKRRDTAREEMREMFASVVRQRRANPDVPHDDVLQLFMEARYKDGRELTPQEMSGMMTALLFAGQHTSTVTSSWTGLLLLKHREFLEPVLKEQETVLEKYQGELTYEALQEMDKLHFAIKEALRMYPPLIFLMRKLTVDKEINGYMVPKGDTLFVSPAVSGRLDVYTEPGKFDPDRFDKPREEDKKEPFSYVGFGAGRHGCLGETFAYLQVKTIWSVLFRNFELELVGPFPKPDYAAIVVGPTHPCQVRYKRITQNK